MVTKYVADFTSVLRDSEGRRISTLLWGDPVQVMNASGGRANVRARGREGWIEESALSTQSLLEIYVIDVGQGDGVLLKTPDGKWHLIDAGKASRDQMTKKGAANFLRWKFTRDLGLEKVSLENLIVTHSDEDHYGGMLDVLAGRLADSTTFTVEVENLYHSGLARFRDAPKLGGTDPGEVGPFPHGYHGIRQAGTFVTELLDDADSFATPPRPLADTFAEYALLVSGVPRSVGRLSSRDGHLEKYAPGENDVTIRVLSPVLEEFALGRSGLRVLGSDSITLNGHSIVLHLSYKQARILLTGDLNSRSQKLLLSYYDEAEFAVDVAKACHHGSEDVELPFIKALAAHATIISSGDNEDYAHPRPVLMGASAWYGREAETPDAETQPPLMYSTELARSVKLAYVERVRSELTAAEMNPEDVEILPDQSDARFLPLERAPLSTDLIYGLVNVRTDGVNILCATMEEQGNDFDVKVFRAAGA